jgi:pimeloyl-ACP methyl ester carboxylesterase
VITSIFHSWEHRLASATKNRVVRPFDWGLEWLAPLKGAGELGGWGTGEWLGNERAHVERYVEEVMRDTHAFFTPPPTSDFAFTPADPERSAHGESGTLRFPSALTTPHDRNNTVAARWFPSEAARRRNGNGHGGDRGPVVLVLPQWNADAGGHIGLAKLLARFGISALRLSLPYHDFRMPEELERADYIVSANVMRTLQSCRQAVLDARRAVDWLSAQGFERIGILGTSLGSCLSLLTAAHEPRIRAAALNHVSPWFADVVWRGLSTRHVRESLDGHVDLDLLRRLWMPISPMSYLDAMKQTRSLLVYARYDLTFPVDLSEHLLERFAAHRLPHETFALPCGHYSTGMTPFKYVDAYVLIRFLKKNL